MLNSYIHIVFEKEYGGSPPYSDRVTVIGLALVIRYPPESGIGAWEMERHHLDNPQQILTLRGSKLWNTTAGFHHEDSLTILPKSLVAAVTRQCHQMKADGWRINIQCSDMDKLTHAGLIQQSVGPVFTKDMPLPLGGDKDPDKDPDEKTDKSWIDFLEV